jgi:hypothetical protein
VIIKKSMFAAAVCAVAMVGAGAGTASAGEITGNGKATAGPDHANSICVFSGQEDNPSETGNVAQSYGQLVSGGILDPHDRANNPGTACRGGSNVPEEP